MVAAFEAAALPPPDNRPVRREPMSRLVGLGSGPLPSLGRLRLGRAAFTAAGERASRDLTH